VHTTFRTKAVPVLLNVTSASLLLYRHSATCNISFRKVQRKSRFAQVCTYPTYGHT